jgi:hypothetical protein
MSLFRGRSYSDSSPLGFPSFSPFRGSRGDPFGLQDNSPTSNITGDLSFFPEIVIRQPSLSFCDGNASDLMGTSTAVSDSIDDCGTTSSSDSEYDTSVTDLRRKLNDGERPWEEVPLVEINHVPEEFTDLLDTHNSSNLRLGRLRGILAFHLSKELEANGMNNGQIRSLVGNKLSKADLINLARMNRLLPLAVRLHLEHTGSIPLHPHHVDYLAHKASNQRPRRELTNTDISAAAEIAYFPGIQLKLGKERDTIIRPMVTSIFRSNREAFKKALLEVGLKYNELRMWKDTQLCTALHVADSFKPGIWRTATELHIRKCSSGGDGRRKRSRIA